jgi:hypothetical protein
VVGTIRLQTRSEHGGTVVMLDGSPVAVTSANGGFAILGYPPGTYTIRATRPGVIDIETQIEILPYQVLNMGEALLPGGDVDEDGLVTMNDLLIAMGAYGTCTGDAGFEPLADQNESGCVDDVDIAIINDNFGRVEPEDWAPIP